MSFRATIAFAPSVVAKLADVMEFDDAHREALHEDKLPRKTFDLARDTYKRLIDRLHRGFKFCGVDAQNMSETDYNVLYREAAKVVDDRRAYRKLKALQRKAAIRAARELAEIEASEGLLV